MSQTIFSVQQHKSYFHCVDYEGKVIGLSFMTAQSAQIYADALNLRHNHHRRTAAIPAPLCLVEPPPTLRPTLIDRLRALGAKARSYKMTRIGL